MSNNNHELFTSPKSENKFDGFSYRKAANEFGNSLVVPDQPFSKFNQGSIVFSIDENEHDEHFELGVTSKYSLSTNKKKNHENPFGN